MTSGRVATIEYKRMSSGYPASMTQKAGKLALGFTSIHAKTFKGKKKRVTTQMVIYV